VLENPPKSPFLKGDFKALAHERAFILGVTLKNRSTWVA
jgi:hypothetical protein